MSDVRERASSAAAAGRLLAAGLALLALILVGFAASGPGEAKPKPPASSPEDGFDKCVMGGTGGPDCTNRFCYCCYDDGCYICNLTLKKCRWNPQVRVGTPEFNRLLPPPDNAPAADPGSSTGTPNPRIMTPMPDLKVAP